MVTSISCRRFVFFTCDILKGIRLFTVGRVVVISSFGYSFPPKYTVFDLFCLQNKGAWVNMVMIAVSKTNELW